MSFFSRLLQKIKGASVVVESPEPRGSGDSDKIRALLIKGELPEDFSTDAKIVARALRNVEIPAGLSAGTLDLCDATVKLGARMKVRNLILRKTDLATDIPVDLNCEVLDAAGSNITSIPEGFQASQRIDLTDCADLVDLPVGLKTGTLVLRNCTKLSSLPEGLDVNFLDISGCTGIRTFPTRGRIHLGRLIARNCTNLESLPSWLESLSGIDLQNCPKILKIPDQLHVSAWIDLAGTGVQSLASHLNLVGLRWRGVPVDRRIVFTPELLTADDILLQRNAEVRRVMLERLGFERFVELAEAEVLDTDHDKGGERKLLSVKMPGDEDLVCVSYSCPSTGRKYVVRVPPTSPTCHAAVAWIAGFDNPDEYHPDFES